MPYRKGVMPPPPPVGILIAVPPSADRGKTNMLKGFTIGIGTGRILAAAVLTAAWAVPALAEDVEWRSEREGNQPAVVLYNRLTTSVQCTATYDTPDGTGGIFGDRRNFIVPATGRTVAVTGIVWNFRIERCAPFPPARR